MRNTAELVAALARNAMKLPLMLIDTYSFHGAKLMYRQRKTFVQSIAIEVNIHSLTHNSTALTQLSAANTGKPEENSEQVNEIVAPRFTANLCVKMGMRQRYESEKLLLSHPFKLNGMAIL